MSIRERSMSLTDQIRQQVAYNRANGDGISYRGSRWRAYGSDIHDYEDVFRLALGTSIASFVKDRKSPVVVDLMAPSDTILTLFIKVSDKNKFGLAVSVEDKRDRKHRWIDRLNNIKQLAGDIMLSSTWRSIDKVMQGRKQI